MHSNLQRPSTFLVLLRVMQYMYAFCSPTHNLMMKVFSLQPNLLDRLPVYKD